MIDKLRNSLDVGVLVFNQMNSHGKNTVVWVLSGSVKETLLGWHGAFVVKTCKKAWQMAPLCIFWLVWKERNLLAFGNEEFSLQRLKYSFVCNLWSWVRVFIVLSPSSFVSFF